MRKTCPLNLISRAVPLILLLGLLASCVPANVPDDAVVSSGRQASWRTSWDASAALEAVDGSARLIPVHAGVTRPTAIVATGDGTGSLLIAGQQGRIIRVTPGEEEPRTVLDLGSRISCCGEQGLIGLEVHPDFERNGLIYTHYNDTEGNTVISEFQTVAGAAVISSERILFTADQPGTTHNGGQLAFGPDGWLYFSLGDGMFSPMPLRRAQNPRNDLGTVSRVRTAGSGQIETIAMGLRNPWRFSFDRLNGDLWIADVGQSDYEEINHVPAGQSGFNFGWPDLEGDACLTSAGRCANSAYTAPTVVYDHSEGCSVTGGFVYRGTQLPELDGHYVYGDFCSGIVWTLDTDGGDYRPQVLFDHSVNITTFGEDEWGELYLADYGLGTLYQLVPASGEAQAAD